MGGGAGGDFRGTDFADIAREFPDLEPVGFVDGPSGDKGSYWDYRGTSPKETEPEFRARAWRLATWLCSDAVQRLRVLKAYGFSKVDSAGHGGTIVFASHQTLLDILCQIILDGTDAHWKYAAPKYRMRNAGITELIFREDGEIRLGVMENEGEHLSATT